MMCEQFRWAAGGWKVQAELVPCGPGADAGFDRVALDQVGDRQKEFCDFYESELADTLRAL